MEEADALCSRVGIMVNGQLELVLHITIYFVIANVFIHVIHVVCSYESYRTEKKLGLMIMMVLLTASNFELNI